MCSFDNKKKEKNIKKYELKYIVIYAKKTIMPDNYLVFMIFLERKFFADSDGISTAHNFFFFFIKKK
jgi:hypothetical protein